MSLVSLCRASFAACLLRLQQMLLGPRSMQPWRIRLLMHCFSHSAVAERSPSGGVDGRDRCLRTNKKKSMPRRACLIVEALPMVAKHESPQRQSWEWRMDCSANRNRKIVRIFFSRTGKDRARKNVWEKKGLVNSRLVPYGPLHGRGSCDCLSGLLLAPGTTGAS